uniref:Uncharacterized protein n=1 Tax=Myoviridae sp. ctbEa13 TaxID=2825136 RepID=A0A8S5VBH3_9CAUD|nr:MAG TPA: hypothetical protein [Myoviridae sp. ctbEa13]
MWYKLDKLNLEFMQVYNTTLLTAINEKVSDFRCTEYCAALVCDRCPFNFKGHTCTSNRASICDGSEVDKEQLVTSGTPLTFEEWQKWFYNVTGITDTRLSKDVLAKTHLIYCDVNYAAGLTKSCGYPEFDFENYSTSDDYKEVDLVEYRKAMKESEEAMKEEAKSTDYIRPTNEDNVRPDATTTNATNTDVDNARINNDPVTENKDSATEHDFRQFIKYNVELILGEDRKKYEYVTLEKMLEIVNTFMITYKSWMTKFTYNDLDDLDYRNSRLGCRVLNASTGNQLMNIYTNESNFGLKRKFVFKD